MKKNGHNDDNRVISRAGQKLYFDNEDLDYYLAWMLSSSSSKGAEFGELFYAASQVKDGDLSSWVIEFKNLGDRLRSCAQHCLDNNHYISASDTLLRASTAYRCALFCVRPSDPQMKQIYEAMRSCFQKASQFFKFETDTVQIPFEDGFLHGYFLQPDKSAIKRPTLIQTGGLETFCEELYHFMGEAGLRRGFNVLLVDLPGQGGQPFNESFFRWDTEFSISAVVDYISSKPEVDLERLALYGISGGGYKVIRAVSFEPRIKACIANAPILDFQKLGESSQELVQAMEELADNPDVPKVPTDFVKLFVESIAWRSGGAPVAESTGPISDDMLRKIECPVLSLVGEAEAEEQLAQASHTNSTVNSLGTKMRVFARNEGADAHCMFNNCSLMQQEAYDWLEEIFSK